MVASLVSPTSNYSFFSSTTTSTTHIYTLSLHDALPISHKANYYRMSVRQALLKFSQGKYRQAKLDLGNTKEEIKKDIDRKSTRLNSSHRCISYAVFCLKKKKKTKRYKKYTKI